MAATVSRSPFATGSVLPVTVSMRTMPVIADTSRKAEISFTLIFRFVNQFIV